MGDLLRDVPLANSLDERARAAEISEVRNDSRQVKKGDLFVALRGQDSDGHRFVAEVTGQGAAAVVVEKIPDGALPPTVIKVENSSQALGLIAANRFSRPADELKLVAVTGTNGKTTTTFLVEALLAAAGEKPGVIGTVNYRYAGRTEEASFTTPTALLLHGLFDKMRAAGTTAVAMEASSIALAADRLFSLKFAVAAFTNLTEDHLDFHHTLTAYRDAKLRLFTEHMKSGGTAVLNVDGKEGDYIAAELPTHLRCLRVSAKRSDVEISVAELEQTRAGIRMDLRTPIGAIKIVSPLSGTFNVENLLGAVGIGIGLGLSGEKIARALGSVPGVPGRLERVSAQAAPVDVFVDYAHTPDALKRAIAAVRPFVRARLIVVFGCGGDRDRTKRPLMGGVVAGDADIAIVTSDNPRTEEPESIIEMILVGVRQQPSPSLAAPSLSSAGRGHVVVRDRRQAIEQAILAARPGDVVLIAGKGHEDYQIIGKTKHHFDDREEAKNALQKVAASAQTRQS